MKNFLQWCEANQKDLKILTDTKPQEGDGKAENRVRTGLRGAYPDGYYRSQYPDLYNTPYSASAPLDMQNAKKIKSKADVGTTPL